MQLNPLLIGTAAPPIPEAKAWTAAYDGACGPLIDLSQAVPGYPPHPALLERLAEAAAGGEAASYGDILGDTALRDAYAAHVSELYGARIPAANVAVTAGCNQGFFVAMIALAKAGDAVILPSPWYFNHKMTLDMLGIEAVALPCGAEAGFVPSADDVRGLIGARTRAIVLVTPNNPTGAVYPPATVHAFQKLCREHGIALIVDETYRDFLAPETMPPHDLFAAPDWPGSLIQLYSFSKSYCIPGYRVGVIVAGESVLAEIAKILDTLQICAPRAGQLVLPWAIPALAAWRNANQVEMRARATAFSAAMARLDGWKLRSIGAYFAYLEHPYGGRRGSDICAWLAGSRGVLCLPGSYFGAGQQKYLRVAFANVDAAAIAEIPGRLAADYPDAREAGLGRMGGMRL